VHGATAPFTRPLAETDFVVVDLETTGGSPEHATIMEIGAVRTRGEPAAEAAGAPDERVFSTLVNPGRAVPEHITALTGITGALVGAAPRIEQVLPGLIEFAAGAVVVAHNAPFDLAFLSAACRLHGLAWPALPVLDTAGLARRVLTTEEAPDCRLGTLARVFAAPAPTHRALDDATATAAVLRGLIGRLAALGVNTLDGVRQITAEDAGCPPGPQRDRMLELTADIPPAPGVCLFLGADGEVLHVLKSSDMRARVCGYFAVSETRRHVHELLEHTERLCPVTRPTALAADVEEIRLITRHRPRYNEEPPAAPEAPTQAQATREAPKSKAPTPEAPTPEAAASEVAELARAQRVVAAGPRFDGGWDLAVIEHGLLAASAALPPGGDPPAAAGRWPAGAANGSAVRNGTAARGAAAGNGSPAERACVLRWLGSPGVRMIEVDR
jgi:DNA polymerase III epsilon subunit-like protein